MSESNTELATPEAGAEVANIDELEAQLAEKQREDLKGTRTPVPFLTPLQGSTKVKPTGVSDGTFYNTLTGEGYATEIEFLIGHAETGRFLSQKDERTGQRRAFAAGPVATVPNHWPEQFRGKAFAELPEAFERYNQMVQEGQIEWGSGPPIQTAYNFLGIVVEPQLEGRDPFPVRLSLKSTSAGAGRKMLGLARSLRTPWAHTVKLSTTRREFKDGSAYVVVFDGLGDAPADEHRRLAIEIAQHAQQGLYQPVEEAAHEPEGSSDGPARERPAPRSDAPGV